MTVGFGRFLKEKVKRRVNNFERHNVVDGVLSFNAIDFIVILCLSSSNIFNARILSEGGMDAVVCGY